MLTESGLEHIVTSCAEAQPIAGWSSLVARRAHNPKVAGSNPAPATMNSQARGHVLWPFSCGIFFPGNGIPLPGNGIPLPGNLIPPVLRAVLRQLKKFL